MGSSLMGSAPSASFNTSSTTSPEQQALMDDLTAFFTTGVAPAGTSAYPSGGQFSAPLSGLQQTSLQALEDAANAGFNGAYTGNLIGQPMQVSASPVDSTAAFQTGVVQPVTNDFLNRVTPTIAGKYGAGAGGAFSSDAMMARQMAAENTSRALAEQGSQFAYDAAKLNQQNDLAAQLANQNANMTAAMADQRLRAQQPTDYLNALLSILGAGGVARDVNQQQLTGQNAFFTDILGKMLQFSLYPTQQTVGVGSAGSSGVLPGLLQAGGTLGAAAITASDERVKEDFERVGDIEGIPLYMFRYKDDPTRATHLGFKAQEVERVVPEAVYTRSDGIKFVDYRTAVEQALA